MRSLVCLVLLPLALACQRQPAEAQPAAPPRPGVTLENYDRLKKDMNLNEVLAILGQPKSSIARKGNSAFQLEKPSSQGRVICSWFAQHRPGESLDIQVTFQDGKVVELSKP